jgi:short repeat uncharacterized protein DUF308
VGRELLARVLLFCAAVLVVAAVVAGYVRYELLSRTHFSDRAAAALSDSDVRAVLSREITDRVVLRSAPDLVSAKPLIESAVAGIAGTPPFLELFEDSVREVHGALLSGDDSRVLLDLEDAGVLVQSALGRLPVRGLDRIQADVALRLTFVNRVTQTAAETAQRLRMLSLLLIVAAVVTAAAGIALAAQWRRAVQVLGFSVAGLAVAVVLLLAGARVAAERLVSDQQLDRRAAGAVWDAFLGDLTGLLLLVAAFATVVAAAFATQATLPNLVPALARGWDLVARSPRRAVWRVARGVALVVAGGLIVVQPLTALRLLAAGVGLFVLYAGIAELLGAARERRARRAEIGRRDLVASLAPAGVGIVAFAAVALFLATGGTTAPAVLRSAACNGSVDLCERRLNEVTLPSSHNAMSSSAEAGWYSAAHTLSIRDQLRAGVRGLLIDAHYGLRAGNAVRTDLSERSERAGNTDRALYEKTLGPEGLAAIQRIRDRVLPGEGEPGVFLCHRFCELGATEITGALREVREFLVERPDEVLVIVIEDYVLPSAIVDAFERSGLAEKVYRGPPTGPFPTLREMIDSGQQVVVYAEHQGGAASWYTAGYDGAIQETPFTFKRAALLTTPSNWPATCVPNRGTDDAPLFLINHWVNTDPTPRPSNAAEVNRRDVLVGRSTECERIRDRRPTLLAVDFVEQGDLYGAVDELNRRP